jgi:tRNA-binding EMAP/Myf-like protein
MDISFRKLASIQKIVSIRSILGADKIEAARVLNWDVVVKKNDYKVGDLVIFIEIDSFVPNSIAPFLTKEGKKPREYNGVSGERLKTVKMKGQISQGLILPISYINKEIEEGEDVTKLLGIIKYDVENKEESDVSSSNNKLMKNKFFKFLMKSFIFRILIGNFIIKLMSRKVSGFPSHIIPKTDETRIQNLTNTFEEKWKGTSGWGVSEKLDGQSVTLFLKSNCFFGRKYGICSRNLLLKNPSNMGSYFTVSEKYEIEKKLRKLKSDYAIQGEIIGGKIQGNKYKRSEYELYVFSIRKLNDGKYLNNDEIRDFCRQHNLNHVPFIDYDFTLPLTIDEILKMANGESKLEKGVLREGLVFRNNNNPRISFKAISNDFLLKNGNDEKN